MHHCICCGGSSFFPGCLSRRLGCSLHQTSEVVPGDSDRLGQSGGVGGLRGLGGGGGCSCWCSGTVVDGRSGGRRVVGGAGGLLGATTNVWTSFAAVGSHPTTAVRLRGPAPAVLEWAANVDRRTSAKVWQGAGAKDGDGGGGLSRGGLLRWLKNKNNF